MASVTIDPRNNRWRVRVYAGMDPGTGKKRWLYRSLPAGASEKEVAAAVGKLEAEASFMRSTGRVLTLDGLVEWYIDDYSAGRLAPGSAKAYRSKYFRHVSPSHGHLPADEVLPFMLLSDLNTAMRGELRAPIGPRTANGVRALLHAAYSAGLSNGLVNRNPVGEVPRMAEPQGERARAFSPDEVQAIEEWALSSELWFDADGGLRADKVTWEDYVTKQAALLALATGMRVGELCALKQRDRLAFPDGSGKADYLYVARSATESGGLHVKDTKGGRPRHVTLDSATSELVADVAETSRLVTGCSEYVLPTLKGKLRRPRTISEHFSAACSGLGLGGGRRFHELRHTHATMLLEQGVSVKVVSERLGHSSPAITQDVYSHLLPGLDAAAAESFAEARRSMGARRDG